MLAKMFETDAEEIARLAACPAGSRSHQLSELPVTYPEFPRGRVLKLPLSDRIVVPTEYRGSSSGREGVWPRRHDGAWACLVIHPVAGSDVEEIVVTDSELRRATVIDLSVFA